MNDTIQTKSRPREVVWIKSFNDDLLMAWVRRDGDVFRAGYHNREYKCTFGRLQDATDSAIKGALFALTVAKMELESMQRELQVVRGLKQGSTTSPSKRS